MRIWDTAKLIFLTASACLLQKEMYAQQGPWNNPLRFAWSDDGKNYSDPKIFQDSAGVPTVVSWKGNMLISAFQWFRQPNPSPSWDRVAVKFSWDGGHLWSEPVPVQFEGLPAGFQRPFDPTLVVLNDDSLRMYFSASASFPKRGLDSTVDMHSAVSTDGLHFTFEPGPRGDLKVKPLIDPAVVRFGKQWHYTAPAGAPQDGAHHFVSADGLKFDSIGRIGSDQAHNWTGNFVAVDSSELRFYGSGPTIWYSASPDAVNWGPYQHTALRGGDPAVVRMEDGRYLMIYVGQAYSTHLDPTGEFKVKIWLSQVQAEDWISVCSTLDLTGTEFKIADFSGRIIHRGILEKMPSNVHVGHLASGWYQIVIASPYGSVLRFFKH